MRVHQITCPKCRSTLKSQAGVPVGQSLSCPKCKNKFTVEEPDAPDVIDDADVIEDAEVVEDLDVEERPASKKKGPPQRRNVESRDDEEDSRPKKRMTPQSKKKRPRDDDDDGDDEEYDERPRKKKRRPDREEEPNLYWRLRHNMAVRIVTWIILLAILAVSGYLLYEKRMREAEVNKGAIEGPSYALIAVVERPN